MKNLLALTFVGALLLFSTHATAQIAGTLTFTAETTTGNGTVTPKLTWSTTPAATSCVASGAWTGTKAASGTETFPAITSSRTYNLQCAWANDRATVSWSAAVQNTDGSALTDLAGHRVSYGPSATSLPQSVSISNPATLATVISPLAAGTWFFAVRSVNALGVESAPSNPVSVVVGPTSKTEKVAITVNPQPNPPTNVTVVAGP